MQVLNIAAPVCCPHVFYLISFIRRLFVHVYECGLHFFALSCRSRSVIGSRAVECIRKIDASVFDAEKAPSQVGEGPGELAYGSGFNVPVVSLASSCACYDASVFRDVFAQRLSESAARIRLLDITLRVKEAQLPYLLN